MSTSAPGTHDETARRLALAATLVVLGAVLTVFYDLTATFGGTTWLVLYVGLAFGAATVAARRAPTRLGVATAATVLVLGLVGYVLLLPSQYYSLLTVDALLDDVAGWFTGQSVALMLEADLWAVSVAPAPVFLVWYLALRGRYDAAALTGGAALGFFVLTGNLDETTTLIGMAALLSLAGFGAVATAEGSWRQLQEVGLVVGLVLLLTRLVQVVPATGGGVAGGDGGPGSGPPLEERLLGDPDSMEVGGRPSLSARPRYTVMADQQAYWHARSFDEYDGRGWTRTGGTGAANRALDPPPSGGTTLRQTVRVESRTRSMPAAWKPVLLDADIQRYAGVTPAGNVEPDGQLPAGVTYDVVSEVPSWTEGALEAAGRDYDGAIRERYTQLPEDLPERLVSKTDAIVEDDAGPYETALTIQGWLERNKSYSLDVQQRDWDIADAFVFAIDEGYCVYFATAMAVMLRAQDVPARFVVGYAPGEEVRDGEWLLRGYHSHAWVEVYFDGVGWVTFDPTPVAPRREAQQAELERARSRDPDAVDDTSTPTPTPTPTPTAPFQTETGAADGSGATDTPAEGEIVEDTDDPAEGGLTPTEELDLSGAIRSSRGQGTATGTPTTSARQDRSDRLWLVGALVTLAFGSVRLGYAQSALRSVRVRYQRRTDDPDRDVERAVERLEYHLEDRFRPRREGETLNQYLSSLHADEVLDLDDRAWRVVDQYHESRYGGGATEADADEAVAAVDGIVRD